MALAVYWTMPEPPPPAGTRALSFLPPADEERLSAALGGSLRRGRSVSAAARARARRLFLETVADLGAASDASGRSLREELIGKDGLSLWWLHPVSYKDCEGESLFERFIELETIREAAGGDDELELWGAPEGLVPALSYSFRVRSRRPIRSLRLPPLAVGLAARFFFTLKMLARVAAAASMPSCSRYDAAILGFWDWSVTPGPSGTPRDRYLGSAPDDPALGASVGWLAWPDPENRRDGGACAPVPPGGRIDLLTRRLDIGNVLEASGDFCPLSVWLRRAHEPQTRDALVRGGWDLRALFMPRLLRGFADASLPRAELIRLSARRALAEHRPNVLISFLETHPVARAVFAAARAGSPDTLAVAVQHSSLAYEKTFYFYEPSEMSGPGPAPVADIVCTMGGLGTEVFAVSSAQVVETGTPRYDWLVLGGPRPPRKPGPWRILLACGQDARAEAELVEAAALAGEGLPMEMLARDHPFSRTTAERRLAPYGDRFRVSTGTLAEDLRWADLVLFTHSTVAEEAVMAGVPAWQWMRLGPDLSALAAECRIPRFDSVSDLRRALMDFAPGAGLPDENERQRLEKRLFHRLDGRSGARVAAAVGAAAAARSIHPDLKA